MRRATRCAHWSNACRELDKEVRLHALVPRHRLKRGGHRQANTASHRILIVHMRFHEPTINYVTRPRTGELNAKLCAASNER